MSLRNCADSPEPSLSASTKSFRFASDNSRVVAEIPECHKVWKSLKTQSKVSTSRPAGYVINVF